MKRIIISLILIGSSLSNATYGAMQPIATPEKPTIDKHQAAKHTKLIAPSTENQSRWSKILRYLTMGLAVSAGVYQAQPYTSQKSPGTALSPFNSSMSLAPTSPVIAYPLTSNFYDFMAQIQEDTATSSYQDFFRQNILPLAPFNETQEDIVDAGLREVAETQGFGYKTANLGNLDALVQDKKLKTTLKGLGCSISVPAFAGISSTDIISYLKTNGFNLKAKWDQVVETLDHDERSQMLTTRQISEKFAQKLQALSDQLEKFFNAQAEITSSQPSFIAKKSSFIAAAKTARQTLIVRSTGKEDNKGLANAGGNESIKNVSPTNPDIVRAAGKVVKSYFSVKSVSQRLASGDSTIFDLPSTPILLQVMIGKTTTPGRRPIECVIHTTEQAGPTRGITSLNCGYGVVESVQKADLCYHFHTGEGHCILAKDVEHLPENIRLALTQLAQYTETHYQRSTDIELLVDTQTGKISIVQSRPLVPSTILAQPSYVEKITTIPSEKITPALTVVAAGSSVRHIEAQNQIIIAPTLANALEKYLAPGFDKSSVRAVVVQGQAEPNSHEATTFASEGKLVMVTDDYDKISTLTDQPTLNLYLDPQQSSIINADENPITISNGYIAHPIPGVVSIEASITPTPLPFAIIDSMPENSLPYLIRILKEGSETNAQAALASFIARIGSMIETVKKDPETAYGTQAVKQLRNLRKFAHQKASDLLPFFTLPSYDLTRLAAIKPIEALLDQHKDQALVNVYSVKSTIEQYTKLKTFTEKHELPPALTKNLELLSAAQMGDVFAVKNELKEKWLTFIINTSQAPAEQQQKVLTLLNTVEQFDLITAWINTIFHNLNTDDLGTAIDQLHAQLSGASKLFNDLADKNKLVDALKQKIPGWSDPAQFDANFEQLQKSIAIFTETSFIANSQHENPLVALATISTMHQFVDIFDRSIKAFEISPAPTDQELKTKIDRVVKMLKRYLHLFEKWLPKGMENNEKAYILERFMDEDGNKHWYKEATTHKVFIFKLNLTLNLETPSIFPYAEQLQPSGQITVPKCEYFAPRGNVTPGAARTLEDAFTVIHQSLLSLGNRLNQQVIDKFPVAMPDIIKDFTWKSEDKIVAFDGKEIKITCNQPLSNHSAQYVITFNPEKADRIAVTLNVFSDNRPRRPMSFFLISFLSKIYETKMTSSLGDGGFTISMTIKNQLFINNLTRLFNHIGDILNEELGFIYPSMLETFIEPSFNNYLNLLQKTGPSMLLITNLMQTISDKAITPQNRKEFISECIKLKDATLDTVKDSVKQQLGEQLSNGYSVKTTLPQYLKNNFAVIKQWSEMAPEVAMVE